MPPYGWEHAAVAVPSSTAALAASNLRFIFDSFRLSDWLKTLGGLAAATPH
jgi:hypothetical protein